MDIGLESYEIKDLFVRLLTPTFFVIITVLQIHYFHKDFLEVTNIERLGFVKAKILFCVIISVLLNFKYLKIS